MADSIVLENAPLSDPRHKDSYTYLSRFVFYNPQNDTIFNKVFVAAPDIPIDGHYLIILFNGIHNYRAPNVEKIVGVIDSREEVEQKTYALAKKLAIERAKHEFPNIPLDGLGAYVIDRTSHTQEGQLELAVNKR